MTQPKSTVNREKEFCTCCLHSGRSRFVAISNVNFLTHFSVDPLQTRSKYFVTLFQWLVESPDFSSDFAKGTQGQKKP